MPSSAAHLAAAIRIRRGRTGKGLFATRPFEPNRKILHIAGRVTAADIVTRAGGRFQNNCFRFGPETYLDPGDGPGAFLNHSCEPNAAVRKSSNRLYLVAVERIRPGDEIVMDYSTIIGDDDIWTMRCRCGASSCRGRARSFGSLPAPLRERYIGRGMVPGYILSTG